MSSCLSKGTPICEGIYHIKNLTYLNSSLIISCSVGKEREKKKTVLMEGENEWTLWGKQTDNESMNELFPAFMNGQHIIYPHFQA